MKHLQVIAGLVLAFWQPAQGQTTHENPDRVPPGRMIDVGTHRLHIYCTGTRLKDTPTVILLHGLGSSFIDWALVQPEIARHGRVCSYDRAGAVWSDPGPLPRGPLRVAEELHTLLRRSGESGPYLLVGHSWGGLIARVYTSQYRSEVAGMVLVDGTHEDAYWEINGHIVVPRLLSDSDWDAIKPPGELPSPRRTPVGPLRYPFDRLPPDAQELRQWARSLPRSEEVIAGGDVRDIRADLIEVYEITRKGQHDIHPLGNMPLVVISAKPTLQGPIPPAKREFNTQMQIELSRLSHAGKFILAPTEHHFIHLAAPEVVISAIRDAMAITTP